MDFNYKLKIAAEPEEVFSALTNPFQIELWSGYPADMKPEAGYEFSLWEGDIAGVNLEIVPNKRLVQEWFFGETEHPSVVRIELRKEGSGNTQVVLEHSNIPEEVAMMSARSAVLGALMNVRINLGSLKDMLEMY